MPAYNAAPFLADAIRSVREQNWPELEIVVVDDGSVDGTQAVLDKLSGPDLTVQIQSNLGPAAARNRGIVTARGTWVAFLDADDLWMPGKLEAQIEALQANPSCKFCYADAIHRDLEGHESIHRPRSARGDLLINLLFGPQFPTATAIVHGNCFARVGFFDPALRAGEDWDLWLRLAANFESCYVAKPLALIRDTAFQMKYSPELMEQCTLRVIQRFFSRQDVFQDRPELVSCKRRLYAWHYSVLAKTHLRQRRVYDFSRLAIASLLAHPIGLLFLFFSGRISRNSSLSQIMKLLAINRQD
jgi:glycosyltransferase involved in cell wall biosynthesis